MNTYVITARHGQKVERYTVTAPNLSAAVDSVSAHTGAPSTDIYTWETLPNKQKEGTQ